MTNGDLAASYLVKATIRLDVPAVLLGREGYSDVVREAQEVVELTLKGMLRHAAVEVPRRHDVGSVLREHAGRFSGVDVARIGQLADVSAWLRENRELSFYGDEGFVPTERYSREDAQRAIDGARLAVSTAAAVIGERRP
ncbi:MAG: HEPN domain-containing protein [Acidobacteria bacterium]|nr:HEPN domain-containing protein [Acidobacteriota bacterium]